MFIKNLMLSSNAEDNEIKMNKIITNFYSNEYINQKN